jgi:putative ATPase
MDTLIENNNILDRPLAYRMRPQNLDDITGHENLLGQGKRLRRMLDSGRIFTSIFFGPPGCGKTALANIIAGMLDARIEKINAVNSNVKDIREILVAATHHLNQGRKTLLIIDEIHRFNKSQQESLLPDVEEGNVILVGLTTENPFYFITGPLISRAQVFKFNSLTQANIKQILINAINREENIHNTEIVADDSALDIVATSADGDARFALNILEIAIHTSKEDAGKIHISDEIINDCIGEKKLLYDRKGDQHYDTISAFIKSIRGSDPDAAVYYLAKMLSSGEDPRFIARRIVISASEDIGNADPQALVIANAALSAVEYIGMPEARITLAQATIYLACAPKSNAAYMAVNNAMNFVNNNDNYEVPVHLTKAGKRSYKYPHNFKYGFVKQQYMTPNEKFYTPTGRGHEKFIQKYLTFINKNENSTDGSK